jgi:hypothetical protein
MQYPRVAKNIPVTPSSWIHEQHGRLVDITISLALRLPREAST